MQPLNRRSKEFEGEIIGRTLGHYRIEAKLGQGGMGVVYRALDTHLERPAAVKVLPAAMVADPERTKRFVFEAKAASSLNNANAISIYDIDKANVDGKELHFIAMEFVDGRTLANVLEDGPVSVEQALDWAAQIASALKAAHAAKLIHRDIKPANIMIDRNGQVKILDFGLAKLIAPVRGSEESTVPLEEILTASGAVIGTPSYMSPEQAEGKPVDARSDVFSLGTVFYEMLTGRRAFAGDSFASIVGAILRESPAPVRALRPEVPADTERIVARCLSKDPQARYETAAGLHSDLRACQSNLAAQQVGFRRLLRTPRFVIAAAIVMAVIAAAVSWVAWRYSRARWVRTSAVPEILRLIDEQRTCAAVQLLEQAERYLANEPELHRIRQNVVRKVSIITDPPGADTFIRDYVDGNENKPWVHLGQTPLNSIAFPSGHVRFKLTKAGLNTAEGSWWFDFVGEGTGKLERKLDPEAPDLSAMVRVKGTGRIKDFWLDRYEVTNNQFRDFVVKSGYHKREHWKHTFEKEGRALSWEQAMIEFRDTTGREGPATWEFGTFPEDRGNYPVGGVSWYEAAAYCDSVNKTLPTALHWRTGAGIDGYYATLLQLSNFNRQGPALVGYHAGLSPYGIYDGAGNVKEWVLNASGDKRVIMGGAWNDPPYIFNMPSAALPFDRSPTNGFRCAKYAEPPAPELTASVDLIKLQEAQHILFRFRDRRGDKPVDDRTFQLYKAIHAYDKQELRPAVESIDHTSPYWRLEKVSFAAAYANERVIAWLYLPKNAEPPYQTAIVTPNALAYSFRDSKKLELQFFEFLIRSGRAVIHPVYKGTYERHVGMLMVDYLSRPNLKRDIAIASFKDLATSLDYLESRADINREKSHTLESVLVQLMARE